MLYSRLFRGTKYLSSYAVDLYRFCIALANTVADFQHYQELYFDYHRGDRLPVIYYKIQSVTDLSQHGSIHSAPGAWISSLGRKELPIQAWEASNEPT